MIDVLTYKGDGVAEKRHNENGKIDYFVAGATFNGDFEWHAIVISWDSIVSLWDFMVI